MIPAKPFLLLTTFMLGSCVPFQPQPITIYNSIESGVDKEVHIVCQSDGTYVLPALPVLDDLADNDNQGVVDRLNQHIGLLRAELRTVAARGGCGK